MDYNNSEMVLISVIVPIYKVEKYLNNCIESIVCQTYKNLEIILVDDGSPDKCPQICDEWKKKDNRIKVIHKKNGGLSDARNAGIDIASGEYYAFIDSDDKIMPRMIEMLYNAVLINGSKLSVCNLICTDENYYSIDQYNDEMLCEGVFSSVDVLENISRNVGSWRWVVAWNKLYHKSLFNNLRYPKGKYNEDEFVIAQILWEAKTVVVVHDQLYCYVQRKDSIMSSVSKYRLLDGIEARFIRLNYIYSIGKTDWLKDSESSCFWWSFPSINCLDYKRIECRKAYRNLARVYRRVFIKIQKYCEFSKEQLWLRIKIFYLPDIYMLLLILKGRKK